MNDGHVDVFDLNQSCQRRKEVYSLQRVVGDESLTQSHGVRGQSRSFYVNMDSVWRSIRFKHDVCGYTVIYMYL